MSYLPLITEGFFLKFIYPFILWLCWVLASVRRPSPAAASGGHPSSRCAGLSPSRPLLLQSTGSRRAGSAIVAHGPSRSVACGFLPDQGSNPCPLHRQADSQQLRHQGSPWRIFFCSFQSLNEIFFQRKYLSEVKINGAQEDPWPVIIDIVWCSEKAYVCE